MIQFIGGLNSFVGKIKPEDTFFVYNKALRAASK